MLRHSALWLFNVFVVRHAVAKCTGTNTSCWPEAGAWHALSKLLEGELLTQPRLLPSLSWKHAISLNNPLVQHQPTVVILAASHSDVTKAVRFAYEYDLLFSVKSTGSCWSGNCLAQGSLHLDLSKLNTIDINTTLRTARLGPGTNFKQVYAAVDKVGLLAVGGMCNQVGPVGFSLGGGHGALVRSFGLGADNILEVTIVLANGTTAVASMKENEDLFWALRGGGGGTFGVVTSITVQLHAAPPSLLSLSCAWPLFNGNTAPGVEALEKWFSDIQPVLDDKWAFFTIVNKKPIPMFMHLPWNSSLDGLFTLEGLYLGEKHNSSVEAVRAVLDLQSVAQLNCTFSTHSSFAEWHDSRWFSSTIPLLPIRTAMSSTFLTEPKLGGQGLAQIISKHIRELDQTALTTFYGFSLGGAVSRVGEEDSAVSSAFRTASMVIESVSTWFQPMHDKDQLAWTRTAGQEMFALVGTHGSYLNEALADLTDFPNKFWGSNYARLQRVKSIVDPRNVFNCAQCVRGGGNSSIDHSRSFWV